MSDKVVVPSIFDALKSAVSSNAVFRINLMDNDLPFKAKVVDVFQDGVQLLDESGNLLYSPFTAISSYRDVTGDPAFVWKGK